MTREDFVEKSLNANCPALTGAHLLGRRAHHERFAPPDSVAVVLENFPPTPFAAETIV
jgi:hypothetical protein